jgi:hypothetical protein
MHVSPIAVLLLFKWPANSLVTSVLFFCIPCCAAGLDFVFHMFFLVKYCKSLEEGEQRNAGDSGAVHSLSVC